MAKDRRPKPASEDTTALFVRLPIAEAEKLDRAAFELKLPKRELIRVLIAEELDASREDVLWRRVRHGPPPGPPGPPPGHHPHPPAPPAPLSADAGPTVGRAEVGPAAEVLTLAEAAELLQTDEGAVRELAERGELPGRRVGGQWRFLRRAVLDWLGAGAEPGAVPTP